VEGIEMNRKDIKKELKLSKAHAQVRRAAFFEAIPRQGHFKDRLKALDVLIAAREGKLPVNNHYQYKTNTHERIAKDIRRGLRRGYFRLLRESAGLGSKSQTYLIRTKKQL
jgi:hypothetical protein